MADITREDLVAILELALDYLKGPTTTTSVTTPASVVTTVSPVGVSVTSTPASTATTVVTPHATTPPIPTASLVGINKAKLIIELTMEEGFVEHAYADHLGFLTIGIGRLIDKKKGGKISKQEADMLLSNDIDEKYAQLVTALPWVKDKSDNMQRALTNMTFQLGITGLLKFVNTLQMIKEGRHGEAADNALQSLWATQTPNRAKRVTDMIRNG